MYGWRYSILGINFIKGLQGNICLILQHSPSCLFEKEFNLLNIKSKVTCNYKKYCHNPAQFLLYVSSVCVCVYVHRSYVGMRNREADFLCLHCLQTLQYLPNSFPWSDPFGSWPQLTSSLLSGSSLPLRHSDQDSFIVVLWLPNLTVGYELLLFLLPGMLSLKKIIAWLISSHY